MGLEMAPFKLTTEMLLIMGEAQNMAKVDKNENKKKTAVHSESFELFMDLVIKGYLAARQHMDVITSLVSMMLDSGLPCFRTDPIGDLRERFGAGLSDRQAANTMITKIAASYKNIFSVIYDLYQKQFEGINMSLG